MPPYYSVHLHCYQPPRENPWSGEVEKESSAEPFHNWNERITEECYGPNLKNFSLVSFDFGPTLLRWLAKEKADVYQGILAADAKSRERFNGCGNAMAHPYHHVILPLATPQELDREIFWGIRDFQNRFGRYPDGFWLPEMAVDIPTLETLHGYGIKFVVLSPGQAVAIRPDQNSRWQAAAVKDLDATMPYRSVLPSGKAMAVFFYDAPYSHEISFGGALDCGQYLFDGLRYRIGRLKENRLFHAVVNGETCGHRKRQGGASLSEALERLEKSGLGRLVNYAYYLEQSPPQAAVLIREKSSWSCPHGVERWRSDCGCAQGEGSQAWREPLREALEWLAGRIDRVFEQEAPHYFQDPYAALKNAAAKSGDTILNSTELSIVSPDFDDFWNDRQSHQLSGQERRQAGKLLEMERLRHAMFTSCGWFFNDIGSFETQIILRHAGRAADFAAPFDTGLCDEFLTRLSRAKSNDSQIGDGAKILKEILAKNSSPMGSGLNSQVFREKLEN